MLVTIKTVDPSASLSETERDALTERASVQEPRTVEVAAATLTEARELVQLAEGEVIAWVTY